AQSANWGRIAEGWGVCTCWMAPLPVQFSTSNRFLDESAGAPPVGSFSIATLPHPSYICALHQVRSSVPLFNWVRWLRSLSSRRPTPTIRKKHRTRASVETLEDRLAPASLPAPVISNNPTNLNAYNGNVNPVVPGGVGPTLLTDPTNPQHMV